MHKEMKHKEELLRLIKKNRKSYNTYISMGADITKSLCLGRYRAYWRSYRMFCMGFGGSRMLRDRNVKR